MRDSFLDVGSGRRSPRVGISSQFCAVCGARLLERSVESRLRQICPVCDEVRYGQLKVGAGVRIQQDGKLLLLRRGPSAAFPSSWNLPSGYCEVDESPRVAAAREVYEEAGLEVEIGSLVGVYYFDDDPRGNGLLILYDATITGGALGVDGHEITQAGFFGPDELPHPLCGGGHDQAIEAWGHHVLDRWQPGVPMRYCPHCAQSLEERQVFGRLRATCASCGFVHFQGPKVGVTVWVEREGRVLLVQRAIDPGMGQWSLPSGFVEWDETPEAAAIRECAEETGLDVEAVDLVDAWHYADDPRGPGINLLYRAQVADGAPRPADDARLADFFLPDELPASKDIAFRGHARELERWRAMVGIDTHES